MEFNRSDQRRRRVLYDEAVQQPVSASSDDGNPSEGSGKRRRRSSNYQVARGQQLKVSELSPTRWWVMGLICTATIAAVAALNGLAVLGSRIASAETSELRDALSMSGASSLTSWVCTVALFCAGLVSLQIYSIRRFRRDDYRGTYRVWLVLAGLFALASLQPVVRLDRIAAECLAFVSGGRVMSPAGTSFAVLRLAVLLAVFVRMLIEMRFCRLGTGLSIVSLLALATAATAEITGASQWNGFWGWLIVNLPLIGCLGLLNGVLAYSRFVGLDASGQLKLRTSSKRRRKSKSGRSKRKRGRSGGIRRTAAAERQVAATSSRELAAKPAHQTSERDSSSGPLQSRLDALRSKRNTGASDSAEDHSDSDHDGERRLSKAERRRLKKLRRRNAA